MRNDSVVRGLGAVIFLLLSLACGRRSDVVRPQSVSSDATYVLGGKLGGWWEECAFDAASRAPHCRIWNGAGLLLEDEEFLPYEGSLPTAGELKIPPDPKFPGPDRIFLSNGSVLLPRSRFDELKIFVDWLYEKRSTPR